MAMTEDAALTMADRLMTPTTTTTSRVGVIIPSWHLRMALLAFSREINNPRNPLLGLPLSPDPVSCLPVAERLRWAIVARVLMRKGRGRRRQERVGGFASVRPALTIAAPSAAVRSVMTTILMASIPTFVVGTRRYAVASWWSVVGLIPRAVARTSTSTHVAVGHIHADMGSTRHSTADKPRRPWQRNEVSAAASQENNTNPGPTGSRRHGDEVENAAAIVPAAVWRRHPPCIVQMAITP